MAVIKKKYIYYNTHLEILEKNIEKHNFNLKEISSRRLSSHITKKEIKYLRVLKVSWFLQVKYDEYVKSKKLKTDQLSDIVTNVNSMLVKDNNRPVTKKQYRKILKNL